MISVIFAASFGSALFFLCLAEQFMRAVFCCFGNNKEETRALRAQMVIGSALNLSTSIVTNALSVVMRCAYALGWLLVWYILFYCIASIWSVVYDEFPDVVVYFFRFYSQRIGPFIHGYLILPLELLNMIFKGLLPFYNACVWMIRVFTFKGMVPIFYDSLSLCVHFAVFVFEFCKSFVVSVLDFLYDLDCSRLQCLQTTPTMDVVTPMSSIRSAAVIFTNFSGKICHSYAVSVEFLLYPLVDVRFAKGLHSLINAVLTLFFHVPQVATQRCNTYGSPSTPHGILMCTPDLQPVFDHAINGVRNIGILFDNWIGIGASLARRSLTGKSENCERRKIYPSQFRNGLLSGSQIIVGLTDWMMGATNGTLAFFFGQVSSDVTPRSWPETVDVRMGVAAVSYEDSGEIEVSGVTQGQRPSTRQTTAMMGCRCIDQDGKGIAVRCSIVQMSNIASSSTHSFDVLFQDATWATQMNCAGTEITVRSVRWPVRRYEGKTRSFAAGYMDAPELDCMSRDSCERVDATIWLVPRCDLLKPEQCSDAAIGTSCYPFCMAVRVTGSRNANPVFVNADTWRRGKQILMRDCALSQPKATSSSSIGVNVNMVSTAVYGRSTLSGAGENNSLYVTGVGDGSECTIGVNMASWVIANASKVDPRSVSGSMRRRGQPFAVAGDTILMEFETPDGSSTIEVDRLSGNQNDVYSLIPGWAGLPAAPKRLVPVQELTQEERARVVVPIDYVTTRVPSTSSRNYVFYAVNPDLRIFQGYLDYCRDPSSLPRVQFMMLSSYSALRVYRVRAYCQEQCEVGVLSSQFTFDGFSDGRFTAANFPQDCNRVYNASIDGLEYVNEQNVAVTVQVADKTYDPTKREGSNSSYAMFWLNPQTMQVRQGDMWPGEVPSALTTDLCLVADGVPHVGTLGAELGVAGLHVLHRIIGALLYAPGLLALWRGGGFCPLDGRGHSVLATCGSNVFSLDDFFDSLDAATAVFWGIPGWVAEQMEQGKVVDYSPVSDLLRGFGAYGRGTVGITEVQGGVMSLLSTPLPEQLLGVYAFMRQPGAASGVAKVAGAASSWARYSARFFAVVCVDVAKEVITSGNLDMGKLWRSTVGALYDQRPFFKSTVTDRAYAACLGLQTMVGGANPLGKLLYNGCLSSALLLDGGMDVFLHLFVDAPMVKCMCRDSEGKLVASYARDHCMWKAPQTMQPILLGMIAAADRGGEADNLLCPAVISYARRSMENTMKPYFSAVYHSLDALGDLVDYTLSGYDTDAGHCSDFWQNPQVVVIMPEPVDYFQGCGATTSCKTRCAGTWDAFDFARASYDDTKFHKQRIVSQSVDSMFFPSVVPDMIAPGKVVAITDPPNCGAWVCRSEEDDCLASASLVGNAIEVTFFCVPISPAASVYKSEVAGVHWTTSNAINGSRQVAFLHSDGSSLVVLLEKQIVCVYRSGTTKVALDLDNIMSLPMLFMYPMQILDFLTVHERVLVTVAVRVLKDGEFERDTATLLVYPANITDAATNSMDKFPLVVVPTLRNLWKGYAVSEYPQGADLTISRMLFWPLTTSGSTSMITLQWYSGNVKVISNEPFQKSDSLVSRATLLPRHLVLSKTLREDPEVGQLMIYASTGSVYDWLRLLRLTGAGLRLSSATLSNSQPINANVSVMSACDGLDCKGCPDLKLRSLCSAYQSCAIFRCIGTPVNLKRPLCGVGGTLKSLGAVGVENVQGAWVMFVDIYMILLQLKFVSNLPGVEVSFPDDAFLGNICAAKDVSAELISILTSTINSAAQRVHSKTGIFSHAAAMDASINTLLSISTAAVTGFLSQLSLAPVYVLAVGHKIMMCQVSGTLALIGRGGFQVDIQPARFSATDAISGQCLTTGAEIDAQQTGDPASLRHTTTSAGEMLSHMGTGSVMKRIEPFMHMLDGALTYSIGVVAKLGEVLQAMDSQHCVLPDVTLKSTVRCACGDSPLSIRPERRREGLEKFALWCSGTLSIPDENNRLQIVWNPFSYQELQNIVGSQLDSYVSDASKDALVVAPNHPLFAQQGVSMFAVLTRCRQNYINKQWDSVAFARYDATILESQVRGGVQFTLGIADDGVGQCLLDSASKGVGNGACLDSYLRRNGFNDDYWGYTMASNATPSQYLDGCLVFSGPASNKSITSDRRKKFQDCLGGYSDASSCDLSGFVWSPASSNDVPVAERHVVYSGNESHMEDAYQEKLKRASDMVMASLADLSNYNNPELQAAVFSAEGDIIHQLLDCVYMGPYARMDYWPGPKCDETTQPDCLVGPYWARDDQKGKTRKLDLDTCEVDDKLPFTCGSKTRKAMVRDFVKKYLETGTSGADLVQKIVQEWVEAQKANWWNPKTFDCNCSGCCGDGYLPKNLTDISLTISTKQLVNALEKRLNIFYRASMVSAESWIIELDQSELLKYNWTTSEGSHRVGTLGLFHPARPTMSYRAEEAMSPPTSLTSPSLWHTCHSALKQVMFTLPVHGNNTLVGEVSDFSGGGVDKIEQHVKSIVAEAERHSPLFRHYRAKHHPSPSRMCDGAESKDARMRRGSVRFGDYKVKQTVIFNGDSVPPIPTLAYDAAVLGGPWRGTYPGLTEHLGFMDRNATEYWLRGEVDLVTSGDFLLRYGAGGLKIGNVPGNDQSHLGLPPNFTASLDEILKDGMSDSDRIYDVDNAVLHGCDEHKRAVNNELGDFVDGLFPMAQGVRESGVGSYCLRFSIELAMLYAMELLESTPTKTVVAQKERVTSWRKKCGTQVQLVGMCNALDLYHDGGFSQYSCLFSWQYTKMAGVENYVTPDCLVKIGNAFYDPCQCKPEWCEHSTSPISINWADIEKLECKMRFDPRSVVQSVELGWWSEEEVDPQAAAWNVWLEDPVNMLNFDALKTGLLLDGQAVGNALLDQHWATSEGFLNDTGLFCDMIADYWPEDSKFPVGYHVSIPCHFSETGYRTFDNVFVQDSDMSGEPVLVYMEDQSREADLVDSNFGAGGLCRVTNFGFDMYETNTMRVCTRVTDGEDVDIHVPAGKNTRTLLGLPRCSESSRDIPWGDHTFYDYYDAAFHSVGTIPNLPYVGAETYPENSARLLVVGPQHKMSLDGWGPKCQDLVLPNCSEPGWACPDGFWCTEHGVCQHPSVQCTRHSDCSGEMMCTGLGTCTTPVVSVDNQLGENASFRAHTSECAGESFSMRGASYWGYVPDLLEAHGMCSYRHWQEYLYTLNKCSCTNDVTGACTLNAKECPYYVFSNQEVNNRWWNGTDEFPVRMKMIPTTCDRDYERFSLNSKEMLSCVPVGSQATLLRQDNTYEQQVSRDKVWRLYDNALKTVSLKRMPHMESKGAGFLGDINVDNIKSCMSVQQCYVDTFTKNGATSMLTDGILRANRRLMSGTVYNPDDQFKCGVIGYYDSTLRSCVLDEKIFPLYHALCNPTQSAVLDKCRNSLKTGTIPAKCDNVQRQYPPQYTIINDVNVPALNEFFHVFKAPNTLDEHLSMVDCMTSIYSMISNPPFESRGLYYPFTFTLYEIPYSWFYQCNVGTSVVVPTTLDRKLYPCTYYTNKNTLDSYVTASDGAYTNFPSYIFNVRGGYQRSILTAKLQTFFELANQAWDEAVESTRSQLFGGAPGTDLSYPRCHTELRWLLPNDNPNIRKIIEGFVRNQCSNDLLTKYIQKYNGGEKNFNAKTIVSEITKVGDTLQDQGGVLASNRILTKLISQFGKSYLSEAVKIQNVNISTTPIRFNYAVPTVDSPAFVLARNSWQRMGGVLPNQVDEKHFGSVQECENSQLIELYRDSTGFFHSNEDTDTYFGLGSTVKVCPVYTTGLFSCHYKRIDIPGGSSYSIQGASGQVEEQFEKYVNALYTQVKQKYDEKMAVFVESRAIHPISMSELPFYADEPGLSFGDFTFDLQRVANYVSNINPDVKTTVMCTAGNQQLDYSTCNDPNFLALRNHVFGSYSRDGSAVIPDRNQMDWSVTRTMMTNGAIYSFASLNRDMSKRFIDRLFDPATVCSSSSASRSDRLCYFSSIGGFAQPRAITPWMAGWWNPYDKCDVDQMDAQNGNTEKIDSYCYYKAFCPPDQGTSTSTVDYYKNMPNNAQCIQKNNQKTANLNVNSKLLYNLCRHTLNEESICTHTQGMVGGSDGYPSEDYPVGGNLYALHEFTKFPSGDGSLFGNALLRGQKVDYGFLRFPVNHIGGHRIGLRIQDNMMRVWRMPLKHVMDKTRMALWDTQDVSTWVADWARNMAEDDAKYTLSSRDVYYVANRDARGVSELSWDCPLRRRAFFTGTVAGFKPFLPSARRSQRLFGHLTGNLNAHPTQVRKDGSSHFGPYRSTNGFCFCPVTEEVWTGMCSVEISMTTEHNCTLFSTVKAISGRVWGWSHTFKPRNVNNELKICTVQTDWPFVNGTMRDGSEIKHDDVDQDVWAEASDTESRRCHVLDRMPDFSYVYVSRRELRKAGFTTLDRGACHTGRAQKRVHTEQRCVRVSKSDTAALLKCTNNQQVTAERPSSATAFTSVKTSTLYRRSCGKCTKPPAFTTRARVALEPETSFGLPYRVSAERAIAADLKRALCGNSTTCDSLLNKAKWVKGSFLSALLKDPESLFQTNAVNRARLNLTRKYLPLESNTAPDDSALWMRPWVHCPTRDSLRTGQGCNGTISKDRWRMDRVGTCYATMIESMKGHQDPFAYTDVCNIDSKLTALCKTIREAQSLVASANCIKSGDSKCALQEYVYNPSTWETTNRAFVHQSVNEFYKRVDGCTDEGDCVCGLDSDLHVLRQRNSVFMKECNAVPVFAFRGILVELRHLTNRICIMAGTFFDVAFNLMLTMSSSAHDLATARMLVAWAKLKQESAVITDKVSDMFFNLMFSTGVMGPWLQDNVMSACNLVNSAYKYTANTWCNLVVRQFPVFLSVLRAFGGWMDVGFTVVNDIFSVILNNYLPEAMLDLYDYGYNEFFMSTKYREKQQAYEKRVQVGLVNPNQKEILDDTAKKGEQRVDNKVMRALEEGREKTMKRTQTKTATSAFQAVVGVSNVLNVFSLGYDVYQISEQIETAKQIVEVMKKFPKTLTLFDFDNFYGAIDALVLFLNGDFMCYDIDKDVEPLQCMALNFSTPSRSDLTSMAPSPSACWAEAQERQVGVSNLYACSPTSTCCMDPLNCDSLNGARLCADCPSVPDDDAIRYGCNTMIQRCQCGLQKQSVDRCLSQSECDAKASCSLLTSLDDVSFGTLHSCTECSTAPVCLINGGGRYGQCTCLENADVKVELCDVSIDSLVNPNPSKLCGYTKDPGNVFAWSELSLVRCINVFQPVCAQVVSESGNLIMMPVASRLKHTQVGYSNRRLLSAEPDDAKIQYPSVFLPDDPADDVTPDVVHRVVTESEWNHTSAPCSTLAHAYNMGIRLGPVDEYTLHSCVYWRTVARQLIKENDLVALRRFDTFLLSAGDFASTLGQRGVMEELLLKPYVLFYAVLYSQTLKPIRAALLASHDANVSRSLQVWKNKLNFIRNKALPVVEREAYIYLTNASRRNHNRRLMGVWEETQSKVISLPYYSLINIPRRNISKTPSDKITFTASQMWGNDNFIWKSFDGEIDCVLADTLLSNSRYVADVLKKYYLHATNISAARSYRKTLKSVIPNLGNSNQNTSRSSKATVTTSTILYYTLQYLGVTMQDIATFLKDPCPKMECMAYNRWTASYLVESLMYCELESVMFCSRDRMDMFVSFVYILFMCIVVSLLFNYLGVYGLSIIMFMSLPLLTIWYSFGVSPRCAPMLPTCLIDDLLQSLKTIFPESLQVPSLLINNGTSTALKKCANIGFASWEDPLTFIWCDMGFCEGLNNTDVLGISTWKFGDMQSAAKSVHADAYRICASVTISNTLPVIFVLTLSVTLGAALSISSLALLVPYVELIWRTVIFHHGK